MLGTQNKINGILGALCIAVLLVFLMSTMKVSGMQFGDLKENHDYGFMSQTNLWTNMSPSEQPTARGAHSMEYISNHDMIIMFGGSSDRSQNETWKYDLNMNTWTNLKPENKPSGRADSAMAFDSMSDRLILFGGASKGNGYCDDTWAYDSMNNSWKDLKPALPPRGRNSHQMSYDIESDKIIMFGGMTDVFRVSNETWAYDYDTNTWKNMSPSISPSVSNAFGLDYDSESDKVVLFGAGTANSGFNETWVYEYNTNKWMNMTTNVHPRWGGEGIAYDSRSDRMIYFEEISIYEAETWTYDYDTNTWENMKPSIQPSARHAHAITYDSESDRTVIFGGYTLMVVTNDETWAYALTNYPFVVSTTPSNNKIGVPINMNIYVTFSEPMNKTVTEDAVSASPSISGTFTWNSNARMVIWDTNTDLVANTNYTITISPSAKSQDEMGMRKSYTFSFTTGTSSDNTAPTIISTTPPRDAINVDDDTSIIITFSETMNIMTAENAVSISPGSITKKEWNSNGTVLTLTASLEEGTTYTVTVSTEAKDLAGNAMLKAYTFSFTTKQGGVSSTTISLSIVILAVVILLLIVLFLMRNRRKKAITKKIGSEKEPSVPLLSEKETKPSGLKDL